MDVCSLNISISNCEQTNVDLEPRVANVDAEPAGSLTDEEWQELARMVSEIHELLLGNASGIHPIQ